MSESDYSAEHVHGLMDLCLELERENARLETELREAHSRVVEAWHKTHGYSYEQYLKPFLLELFGEGYES